jgi:hypothetical protein
LFRKAKERWREEGPWATIKAAIETLAWPLFRFRRRFVYEISLRSTRAPSQWGPDETLLRFGPENIDELSPELLATTAPEEHLEELKRVRLGNQFFVVVREGRCVYRSYIRLIAPFGRDRKTTYFGLETLPEIRSQRSFLRGFHTRVVNEQLRYLQSRGYSRALLSIMARNTVSIRANTASGFQMFRTLNDWIVVNILVFQQVIERGKKRWRVFFQ